MSSDHTCVLALDAGTTGVRTRAVFADGRPPVSAYREFTQHFPRPGWVEHDATEIWEAVKATMHEVVDRLIIHGTPEECRAHIQRYRDNGVTTPALAIMPFGIDQRQAVRDLAPR